MNEGVKEEEGLESENGQYEVYLCDVTVNHCDIIMRIKMCAAVLYSA